MADPRDDRVSSAYREMPGVDPSPALDAAIRAAARRAVGARPGGARRWQIPVSIAAVLALAVGISLQVDREKPVTADGTPAASGSAEYPVRQRAPEKGEPAAPQMPATTPAAPAQVPLPKEAPAVPLRESPAAPAKEARSVPEAKRFVPEPPRSEPSAPASPAPAVPLPAPAAVVAPSTAPMPAPFVPPPPTAPASASMAAPPAAAGANAASETARASPQAAARAKSEASRDAATQEKAMAGAVEAPEKRLERIAELRAKGHHDEADHALDEFHRAYPGYRISEEWLRKVERR